MRQRIKSNIRAAVAFAFAVASLGVMSISTNAQTRWEKEALKQHQRQERAYYGNNYQIKDHQKAEKHQLKHSSQGYYNNGYYNNGYNTNNGYYGNTGGYNNNGYYNNNPYHSNNNRGYYPNSGYYGSGGVYRTPHRDSRNPVKRTLHHLLGGH